MNAGNSSFSATPYVIGNAVWIYARTPRAPGNVADPATGLTNFGFHPTSNLSAESAGPFAPLGDLEVANYDGTAGFDSSFDHALKAVTDTNGFRESWSFFPIHDPVENGSQTLVGLSYTRDSWRRIGADEEDTFAEEPLHRRTGYLLWDRDRRRLGSWRCREVWRCSPWRARSRRRQRNWCSKPTPRRTTRSRAGSCRTPSGRVGPDRPLHVDDADRP